MEPSSPLEAGWVVYPSVEEGGGENGAFITTGGRVGCLSFC